MAFRNFLDENYAEDMARAPFTASYRGIKTNHGQWDSVAESHQEETRSINEARLRKTNEFDVTKLDESMRLSWEWYRLDLQRRIASDKFRHHKFITHQLGGAHTKATSNLINVHTVSNLADAEAYISRLHNINTWFDEVIEQLRIRRDKDLLMADWQYLQMIQAANRVIKGAPFEASEEDSALWADFKAKLALPEISPDRRTSLLADARTALVDTVKPAYLRLITEMESHAAIAPDADGVWKFEDGDAFYAERLNWYTQTDLPADEIHRIGLREVERIHNEIKTIMAKVDFDGTLEEFFNFVREDDQFYYPNTPAGRNSYLNEVESLTISMNQRTPKYFGLQPESAMEVKRVESFREKTAAKAYYQWPPPDGSRPGIFYVNLYDMADMPKYQMEALVYHEGIPGHHLQQAISAELEDVPEFQKLSGSNAYSEGWGLYAEFLAKEMGAYEDPYSDFGRLAMELWRACRLVVDTGIHSKRWSREEAIDYLLANTPNSEGDSIKAIERYIAVPGQANAYMIGKLKILELRERAREAMGDQFDIRQFHDVVLKDGPVPLSLLEKKVDAMIAASTAG